MFKHYIVCLVGIFLGILTMSCTSRIANDLKEHDKMETRDRLTGKLDINPVSNLIIGKIRYSHFLIENEKTEGLSFFIPIDLTIADVSGENIESYEVLIDTSSYIGQFLKTIHVKLNPSVAPDVLLDVNFEYSGTVDFRGFAELDYPTPWIEVSPNTLLLTPIPVDFPEARYSLKIKLPSGYQVITPGKTLIDPEYPFMIDSQDYIKGVYFIIGSGLSIDHLKYGSTRIRLVSYEVPQTMKDRISEMTGWTIDYYNNIFGEEKMQDYVTISLRPSDEWDASFAAGSNYFVSYDSQSDFMKNEAEYFATYAHEMAHFWWKEADALTNSNWLNEGFAEFSSMLAIKSFYGQEAFEKKIKYHQAILEKVPQGVLLGNFERFGKHDQSMSYSAGALLLNDIYTELGDKDFHQFLVKLLKKQIVNTDQFSDHLIQNFQGKWLDAILAKI